MDTLRHFKWDVLVLIAALVTAFFYGGGAAVYLTAILIVVEIVFSFDNAAVNAKYLARMNEFWQKMFLTVGILIAVFGMRLIFPFVIVSLTGSISPAEAFTLALEKGDPEEPGTYGYILEQAHPSIAAFGGMFLIMLFLDFLFDSERESHWLSWIEKPLQKVGRLDQLSVVVAGIGLLVASETLVHDVDERATVLFSGLLGIILYLGVNGLASVMEAREEAKEEALEAEERAVGHQVALAGKAAFSLFMFLEVLDATFSFDGVIGAFAITPDPVIIALGLGVGALFVRSMTVFLVRKGTLAEYRYLEHGAHWAIGALATMLILTLHFDIPDIVIGLVGLVFIVSAWVTSTVANRRDAASVERALADGAGTEAAEAPSDAETHAPGIYASRSTPDDATEPRSDD
ncbi:hypothetical protein CLV28_3004 [Sediminihabitans luteus]|uniref:YkoY family integral membrane protein n=1 Tax=Sediminihabitans luteus TaxID=1138585 RepID=A0A2M9CC54_9CELL|nr:DUF475 domain-containing protein [Sediminihabitans luteus]PJJ68588.1 hypothetical protein CLV28_3004 [Sediminihabitans luteus]GII99926.1 hypothetical protein Slu03_23040 [Sediminihabitans luteus]